MEEYNFCLSSPEADRFWAPSNKLALLGGVEEEWVRPRRDKDETLAFLLMKAKYPVKIDITQVVRDAIFVLAESSASKPDSRSSPAKPSQPW